MTNNFSFIFHHNAANYRLFEEMWNYQPGFRPGPRVQHHTASPRPAPKRTVHAERVGPPELTDGVLRPSHVLWTWPMILDRLEPFAARWATIHQPQFDRRGNLSDCTECEDGLWPCAEAEEILGYFGLTKRDLDYRPEDVRDEQDLFVQGAGMRAAEAAG